MREIVDDLSLAGGGRQNERAALPVGKGHSVVFQNAVRRRHAMHSLAAAGNRVGVASKNTGTGDGIGPVLRAAENPAQRAHRWLSAAAVGLTACAASGGR